MKVLKDIVYASNGCTLDVYLPERSQFSVMVYFHGGGLSGGSKAEGQAMGEYLAAHGIAVVSANYRLYPKAAYPEFIEDCAEAAAWAREHMPTYGKCDQFMISGTSAGGYISMMLCFDPRYLARHGLKPTDFAAFVHDAGQPTKHFNVLTEFGLDNRRVVVDECAPLYHVGTAEKYPPMLFIVSDNDMTNRYEQTMLMVSTLKHFGHGQKVHVKLMHGGHCAYVGRRDEMGQSVFGQIIMEFLTDLAKDPVENG